MLYFARLVFFIYTALLIALCLVNVDQSTISPLMQWDKLLHLMAYFTFATLGLFAASNRQQYMLILCLGFALGASLEFAQSGLTNYRSASMHDQVANSFGLMLSFAVSHLTIVQNYWPLAKGLNRKE